MPLHRNDTVTEAATVDGIEISLIDQEPRVDSRLIAKRMGVDHRSTFRLVTKFKADLEELGLLRFEIAKVGMMGRPEKFAHLNEDQSVFLLTLTRNTPEAVDLKLDLTKAFKRFRDIARRQLRQAEKRAALDWQQARQEGKATRRELAAVLADFVAYARGRGCRHPESYFVNVTRMVYRAFFQLSPEAERRLGHTIRDHLDARQLRDLASVEDRLALEIDDRMAQRMDHKAIFSEAKALVAELARIFRPAPVLQAATGAGLTTGGKSGRRRTVVQLPLLEPRAGHR
jgi:phage regulator Rha-like protein